MKKYIFYIGLAALIFFSCSTDDSITGPNTIESLEPVQEGIVADGVSSINLVAVVYDTLGAPAENVNVRFTSSHGEITRRVHTNTSGEATAELISLPSIIDINVTVTATVLDSGDLGKSSGVKAMMALGVADQIKSVKEAELDANQAQTTLTFFGVTKSVSLSPQTLPADGSSGGTISLVVKETNSHKSVSNGPVEARAIHNTLPSNHTTNSAGKVEIGFTALTTALRDTFLVTYGGFEPDTLLVEYVEPILDLKPDSASIRADGNSQLVLTAQLKSPRNNPITGAKIDFTTSAGLITRSAQTDAAGQARAVLTSSPTVRDSVQIIATFYDIADTSWVRFGQEATNQTLSLAAPPQLLRNGAQTAAIRATLTNESGQPIEGEIVHFQAEYGEIDTTVTTNSEGVAAAEYIGDAGETTVNEVITARAGDAAKVAEITLHGIIMQITALPDSITADGQSKAGIHVNLKRAVNFSAITGAQLENRSSMGHIQQNAVTDEFGNADFTLTSETTPGAAEIYVRFGEIEKTTTVKFNPEEPNTILLSTRPNFIWVKESGNPDQTNITAQVLSQTGQPVGSEMYVQFSIRNGTGGGETISPRGETAFKTTPIKAVNGTAHATLKAGIRPGTIEIEASVVNNDQIRANTTPIVIRSGPPYIYIDPADPHNVEPHMTLTFNIFNKDGWNNVRKFAPSVYIGDKYNNPVERNTAVYLTSTAGIISTDVLTDELGEAGAVLSSANPRPYVEPNDPMALAPHRIPNPNMPEDDPNRFLPITVPDFDGMTPHGTPGENDGVAYVLATTHGRDQFGNDAVVWSIGRVIFSGPLLVFNVTTQADSLNPGQAATINIEVFDLNGNPVAAGSSLNAKASAGKLSATDLMPAEDRYGFGSTLYQTNLLNNLDPVEDEPIMAEVTVELDSPNGLASGTVYIYLKN